MKEHAGTTMSADLEAAFLPYELFVHEPFCFGINTDPLTTKVSERYALYNRDREMLAFGIMESLPNKGDLDLHSSENGDNEEGEDEKNSQEYDAPTGVDAPPPFADTSAPPTGEEDQVTTGPLSVLGKRGGKTPPKAGEKTGDDVVEPNPKRNRNGTPKQTDRKQGAKKDKQPAATE